MNLELPVLNLVLTLTRCGSFILFSPQFGDRDLPRQVKIGLTVALTAFWFDPARPMDMATVGPGGAVVGLTLLLLTLRELLLGAAVGFLFHLLFVPARIAGSLIGQEMGLTMATVADPGSPSGANLMNRLLEMLAIVLFFSLNVHHVLLAGLHSAFSFVPIGTKFQVEQWAVIVPHFSRAHTQGMLLAAPTAICLFVLSASLTLLTRATPQLNLFSIGFPLRILAGLVATLVFLPQMVHLMSGMLGQAHGIILELLR